MGSHWPIFKIFNQMRSTADCIVLKKIYKKKSKLMLTDSQRYRLQMKASRHYKIWAIFLNH